jgi:soluble lytic murein transglycosylase-like protein
MRPTTPVVMLCRPALLAVALVLSVAASRAVGPQPVAAEASRPALARTSPSGPFREVPNARWHGSEGPGAWAPQRLGWRAEPTTQRAGWLTPAASKPAPGPADARMGRPDAWKNRLRSNAERLLASGEFAYLAMVHRVARHYSVESKLVMAIIASESGGDPNAVSPAGAVGLMQLMPETAADLGVDPWDPEQNVDGAVRLLSSFLSTFRSVDLTLVAYNAGPAFAMRYRDGAVELGAETRAFITRVGDLLR